MFEALKDFWFIWSLLLILTIYPFFIARIWARSSAECKKIFDITKADKASG